MISENATPGMKQVTFSVIVPEDMYEEIQKLSELRASVYGGGKIRKKVVAEALALALPILRERYENPETDLAVDFEFLSKNKRNLKAAMTFVKDVMALGLETYQNQLAAKN